MDQFTPYPIDPQSQLLADASMPPPAPTYSPAPLAPAAPSFPTDYSSRDRFLSPDVQKQMRQNLLYDPQVPAKAKLNVIDQQEKEEEAAKILAAKKAQDAARQVGEIERYNQKASERGLPAQSIPDDLKNQIAEGTHAVASLTSPSASASAPSEKSATPSSNVAPSSPMTSLGKLDEAFELQKEGGLRAIEAGQKKANAEAAYLDQTNKNLEAMEKERLKKQADRELKLNDQLSNLQKAQDEFSKAPNVDQNRLWSNASVPSKISAIIGIGLGAFAGGVNGKGGNVAMDMLNKAIDRDIDAQKESIAKSRTSAEMKNNLITQMRGVFGDSQQADTAARSILLDQAKLKLQQIAAQSASPEAQAKALSFLGEISQKQQMARLEFLKGAAEAIKAGEGTPVTEDQYGKAASALSAEKADAELETARAESKKQSFVGKAFSKVGLGENYGKLTGKSEKEFIEAVNRGKTLDDKEYDKEREKYFGGDSEEEITRKKALRLQEINKAKIGGGSSGRKLVEATTPKMEIDQVTGRPFQVLKDGRRVPL